MKSTMLCKGFTKRHKQCSKKASYNGFCYLHAPTPPLPVDVWSYIIRILDESGKFEDQKRIIMAFSLVSKLFESSVREYLKPLWCRSLEPKNDDRINNSVLKHLSRCIYCLDLYCNEYITDDGLSQLKGLRTLKLWYNYNIAGYGLAGLPNLKTLILSNNSRITNTSIYTLTNLTRLELIYNGSITDSGISQLTNLKVLKYEPPFLKDDDIYRSYITDESISKLTNLTDLSIKNAKFITDKSIFKLMHLKILSISDQTAITLESITTLKSLKVLTLQNAGIYFHEIDKLGMKNVVKFVNEK